MAQFWLPGNTVLLSYLVMAAVRSLFMLLCWLSAVFALFGQIPVRAVASLTHI